MDICPDLSMNLHKFIYDLPESLIAQNPLTQRDKARLMIIERNKGIIHHDTFSNIAQYLPEKSSIVLNDTKVIPARLLGKRQGGGANVEIFLLKKLENDYCYETLMRPMRRLKIGEKIIFDGGKLTAQIVDKKNRIVRFNKKNILRTINRIGHTPLPPYIKRTDAAIDKKYYQTVFAKKPGSVAAPTAGLHFTPALLYNLKKKGHCVEKVTLHVNYGTFQPVEVEDIRHHKMHEENYSITKKTFNSLKKAKTNGHKIIAVGTTSSRVLETIAQNGILYGKTNIFIYPGFQFHFVDILITNFHLPCSTLLMLVYAFGSPKLMKKAYQEAIKMKYRFYSYGDAMIII